MMSAYTFRALIIGIAFAGILFLPPWLPLLATGLLALRFVAWEAIIAGLLVDFLYSPGIVLGVPFPATILMVVVVVALHPWRAQLAL